MGTSRVSSTASAATFGARLANLGVSVRYFHKTRSTDALRTIFVPCSITGTG